MNPANFSPFANHLWQSTLFAGVAGLATLALRNHHARVRHWVWLAASCKFLIPFSLVIALGGQIRWRAAPEMKPSNLSAVMDAMSHPFTASEISSILPAAVQPASRPLLAPLWAVWACGFLGIACSWW